MCTYTWSARWRWRSGDVNGSESTGSGGEGLGETSSRWTQPDPHGGERLEPDHRVAKREGNQFLSCTLSLSKQWECWRWSDRPMFVLGRLGQTLWTCPRSVSFLSHFGNAKSLSIPGYEQSSTPLAPLPEVSRDLALSRMSRCCR